MASGLVGVKVAMKAGRIISTRSSYRSTGRGCTWIKQEGLRGDGQSVHRLAECCADRLIDWHAYGAAQGDHREQLRRGGGS